MGVANLPTGPLLGLPDPAGRRIGLFGGSFNPPHPGHIAIASEALTRVGLDQIWWLVSPQNPLKDPQETEDFALRLAATRTLVEGVEPRFRVLDIESKLSTTNTAATFRRLRPVIDRGQFVWVMGADSFAGLHRWNDWRTIPSTMPLAVFARPGFCLKALFSPAARMLEDYRIDSNRARALPDCRPPAWCFLTMPLRPESSTAIRRALKTVTTPSTANA